MSGSFSDYLEKKILDHVLGGSDYERPSKVYVGLATATINDATTGSTVTEPSSSDAYARVEVTNNSTNWPAAAGTTATKKNGIDIVFPEATGNWGSVTYFFIADENTGGNILMYGSLTNVKTIGPGDIPRFDTDSISITLD